jgi:hypothetical protein
MMDYKKHGTDDFKKNPNNTRISNVSPNFYRTCTKCCIHILATDYHAQMQKLLEYVTNV